MEWTKKLAFSFNKKRFNSQIFHRILKKQILQSTDLSHSKAIIEIEGQDAKRSVKERLSF